MKMKLQFIGMGGILLSVVLIATGAMALHSDAAIVSGGAGFIGSAFLKTVGDLIK